LEICNFLQNRRVLTWIEALGAFERIHVLTKSAQAIRATWGKIFDTDDDAYGELELSLQQLEYDLLNIAVQVADKVSKHPRTIHLLSEFFPRACAVAQDRPHYKIQNIEPQVSTWSTLRAIRRVEEVTPGQKVSTFCFTLCGQYLLLIVSPEYTVGSGKVRIDVYETQSYRKISSLQYVAYDDYESPVAPREVKMAASS
jgi:hypothetical protein